MGEKAENVSAAIDRIIEGSCGSSLNRIRGVFLDETLSEMYGLEVPVVIPSLPVKEIDGANSVKIAGDIAGVIPQYLRGHRFLEKRKPPSEQHSLHFIMPVEGVIVDFVHILRLDFRFSGRSGRIITKGDTLNYPSFEADNIYFKSRIVPVRKGSDPFAFEAVRLKEAMDVETDKRIFTSVIFDEFSNRELSIEFSKTPGTGIFPVPVKIYPFIVYEYFTACLSIPDPIYDKVPGAARLFEPLFLCLYLNYRGEGGELDLSSAAGFGDYLVVSGGGVTPSEKLLSEARSFFSSYSLFADDDLMLKGWKKINTG